VSEPHIVVPEWMTSQQVEAIGKLFDRNSDGSPDRHAFFARVQRCGVCSDQYAGIHWCGIFVGIEKDGYTHS
jgi:hypothetical protein